jgi:hypothetical protein
MKEMAIIAIMLLRIILLITPYFNFNRRSAYVKCAILQIRVASLYEDRRSDSS